MVVFQINLHLRYGGEKSLPETRKGEEKGKKCVEKENSGNRTCDLEGCSNRSSHQAISVKVSSTAGVPFSAHQKSRPLKRH